MNFNPTNKKYPLDLVESSFQRECKNLEILGKYKWAPEVLDIDQELRKITFKWYNNTAESYLPSNYILQLENIIKDLDREQLYKPNVYPKCFYTDNNNQLHAYIFYSTSSYEEQPIAMEFYKPVLNEDRLALVEKLSTDGKLDMGVLIKYAFTDYIKWPGNPLPDIYKRVYE